MIRFVQGILLIAVAFVAWVEYMAPGYITVPVAIVGIYLAITGKDKYGDAPKFRFNAEGIIKKQDYWYFQVKERDTGVVYTYPDGYPEEGLARNFQHLFCCNPQPLQKLF